MTILHRCSPAGIPRIVCTAHVRIRMQQRRVRIETTSKLTAAEVR